MSNVWQSNENYARGFKNHGKAIHTAPVLVENDSGQYVVHKKEETKEVPVTEQKATIITSVSNRFK